MPSKERTFVIIGNGVAGTTCAETLRKNDPNCRITLISDEPYPLYNRVALPLYLKLRTPAEKVFLRTVEWHQRNGIDLLLETRVTAINVSDKTVITDAGSEHPYDALLIATGGRPNPLSVPGAEASGVFNFQYLDDARAIQERISQAKSAVAVGGSYIAYELAEAFRARGLDTTWLIRGPRFLRKVLDEDGGALVDDLARQHGVEVVYGQEVGKVVNRDGQVTGVVTTGGKYLEADLVGCGLGMTWNTSIAADAGLEVRSGIVTNQYLETSIPGIYAAGDVAQFFDVVIDRHNQLGTWGNSAAHGKIAALNMLGQRTPYVDVPMYSSTLFDSYIRVIGLTPENYPDLESWERLDAANRNYQRLFFLDNRLVGAVLIGDMRFRGKIFQLIKSREVVPVEQRGKLLEE